MIFILWRILSKWFIKDDQSWIIKIEMDVIEFSLEMIEM